MMPVVESMVPGGLLEDGEDLLSVGYEGLIEAIVVCHDRPIPDDMAEAAKREEVAIITTSMSQFEASVALAALPAAKK
jgi:hypothetical protein